MYMVELNGYVAPVVVSLPNAAITREPVYIRAAACADMAKPSTSSAVMVASVIRADVKKTRECILDTSP